MSNVKLLIAGAGVALYSLLGSSSFAESLQKQPSVATQNQSDIDGQYAVTFQHGDVNQANNSDGEMVQGNDPEGVKEVNNANDPDGTNEANDADGNIEPNEPEGNG